MLNVVVTIVSTVIAFMMVGRFERAMERSQKRSAVLYIVLALGFSILPFAYWQ